MARYVGGVYCIIDNLAYVAAGQKRVVVMEEDVYHQINDLAGGVVLPYVLVDF